MSKEPTKGGAPGKSPGTKAKRKLTHSEKKQIVAAIRQAKGDGKAHTAQQTIPYINLYPDGICRITEKKYSKSIVYEDINYQLAQADDKTAIFENWCDFLNYFDASVSVQLSFINQGTKREEAEKAINIPAQEDAFNSIRTEYGDMLKSQLSKGNNGLVKHKYITFSIEADNMSAAKSRLSRIETDILNNFKVNAALVRYNPEIIAATKEAAISALRARETKDNEIAAQKGLKPYTLLNVEFNDGTDEKSSGHMGWYYVTLAVGGEIHSHIETGLNYAISDGKVSENPTREDYFVAGALKETDVDYVFNNVGFSSTSDLYSLPISGEVRERAEKTLAERSGAQTEKAADPQSHAAEQPEPTETKVTYYPINEAAAKRAKQAISFSDYKPGSATAEYRHYVDEAAELAARQKKRVDPSFHEKIDGLLDAYARKLAANMNKGYEITARVPSIMIAGGSNFPVRKKEKQNAAADKNMEEYREIQGLLGKELTLWGN